MTTLLSSIFPYDMNNSDMNVGIERMIIIDHNCYRM